MNRFNRLDLPLILPVIKVEPESNITITLTVEIPSIHNINPSPGQYFMLWLPEIDEIPISTSNCNNDQISFTICSVGQATEKFLQIRQNQEIGLRGPFGNGFEITEKKNAIIIAGGMGIAPLRYLIHFLLKSSSKKKIIFIYGAKTKQELIFFSELNKLNIERHYCTEDGSYEFKGFSTTILSKILDREVQNKLDWDIFTCGPELMMKEVLKIVNNQKMAKNTQFSLADRYIRCGFGLCGSCFLDNLGLSICKDGPIFKGDILNSIEDFGNHGRKANGSKYSFS